MKIHRKIKQFSTSDFRKWNTAEPGEIQRTSKNFRLIEVSIHSDLGLLNRQKNPYFKNKEKKSNYFMSPISIFSSALSLRKNKAFWFSCKHSNQGKTSRYREFWLKSASKTHVSLPCQWTWQKFDSSDPELSPPGYGLNFFLTVLQHLAFR